ncbi:PREDICTED: uncharacterized protein LOC106751534 isoform X1 [Dinoponera quadriceps]|uniref:Uncharacterized protein LOC106751534 isoform X1 n=1 Tax=Dinoponera quadriceps TaxID=609295 RepID=A0A6P3YDJ9_DINQU|nr:PREDICTED: uncharacterized protein LOC106751534 isoform X1 [Dinoponera quadriceps]
MRNPFLSYFYCVLTVKLYLTLKNIYIQNCWKPNVLSRGDRNIFFLLTLHLLSLSFHPVPVRPEELIFFCTKPAWILYNAFIGDNNGCREEDNDDVVPIIDGETTRLKELYGEYYISEMIRYPDGCRQLIIGEDVDGSAAGVMCLSSTIDIDLLNENFELTAYHGFRKAREDDEEPTYVAESNELPQAVFSQMSRERSPLREKYLVFAIIIIIG